MLVASAAMRIVWSLPPYPLEADLYTGPDTMCVTLELCLQTDTDAARVPSAFAA